MISQRDFFLTKVEKTSTCWNWMKYKTQDGYGQSKWGDKLDYAHRIAYELFVGDIPKGMVIDHLCRNRGCVNPDHLEAVDVQTNILRGISPTAKLAKMTHCVNGHEFTPNNIYFSKLGRNCRTCRRENGYRYRAALRSDS